MEDFKIVNTARIQIQSVVNFLQELGYTFYPNEKVFESVAYETNKARKVISFATAVKAHNGHYTETHGRGFEPCTVFWGVPYEWWCAAQRAKIVHNAKLQYSKKKNAIITQNHMVRFVEPENVSLFIK